MAKKEIKKSKKVASRPVSTLAAHAEQAIKDYDQALGFLRRKDYSAATEAFEKVLSTYPDEKEMADRCRVYLTICRREVADKTLPLKKAEDYYYQAVFESNRQHYDAALSHLDKALKMEPGDERILYATASTAALKGEREQALSMLKEAIQANPQNRIAAQHDPDFEPLRDDDAFIDLVAAARE
ncbi:MAG TPA: tetratricopeptide repeat protein [Candidatus Polarisedimenticolia bacterium]|nr:tetratricopeptide repeat protein [Candidatus Polarisedimenticolia bacterium]